MALQPLSHSVTQSGWVAEWLRQPLCQSGLVAQWLLQPICRSHSATQPLSHSRPATQPLCQRGWTSHSATQPLCQSGWVAEWLVQPLWQSGWVAASISRAVLHIHSRITVRARKCMSPRAEGRPCYQPVISFPSPVTFGLIAFAAVLNVEGQGQRCYGHPFWHVIEEWCRSWNTNSTTQHYHPPLYYQFFFLGVQYAF